MRMNQIKSAAFDCPACNVSSSSGEGRKPVPVVVPVAARGIGIGAAFARKIIGSIENEQLVLAQLAGQQPGRFAKQRLPFVHCARFAHSRQHCGVTRDERGDGHAMFGKRAGQCACHISQAACFHQWHSF